MGFFDFLVDAGADLFGLGKDEAEEVKTLLTTELGESIQDLAVTFEGGAVTLTGAADSQATREKAMLLAGNIKGVERVDADGLTFPEPEKVEEVDFYTVQRGDSLSLIAKRLYGNAMKYPEIFEANREVIKDPDLIYPGQTLRIPKQ
ncbi:MAG: peptidoglycan-binding protein LysM [Calditrichia bacterium]